MLLRVRKTLKEKPKGKKAKMNCLVTMLMYCLEHR